MFLTLWHNEWRLLWRERTAWAELAAFVVCCALIFRVATPDGSLAAPDAIVLWLISVFGVILHAGHLFDRECASDGSRVLEGFAQLPNISTPLFLVKWTSAVCVQIAALFLTFGVIVITSPTPHTQMMLQALMPILCGIAGLAALGTLFGAVVTHEARKGFLLAMICYPLALPLILAVSQAVQIVIAVQILDPVWMKLVAGTALLYITLSAVLFRVIVKSV